MKRILLFILLVVVTIGLPVTVVHAQTMEPGCNPVVWGYLENQANATRARNRAYEREILNRQESTLYLTCFDQAMAVSSKLGMIFSDVFTGPPPANTVVFTNPAYPDWGAAQPTLAMDLGSVVNPEFNDWLDAAVPDPAMFNFLPAWLPTNNQLTTLVTAQQSVNAAIIAYQGGDAAQAQQYVALVQQINQLVQSLPTVTLEALTGENQTYTSDIGQLSTLVSTISSTRSGQMASFLSQLEAPVSAFTYTCTRIDDLWNKMDPGYTQSPPGNFQAGTFYPPESTTYYPFSPYYTLQSFLNVPPSPPATADFAQELTDATDSDAMQQAMTDLTGPLSAAGQSAIWPQPPLLMQQPGQSSSAQDIINQM